jgi:hypothetical protein
LSRDIIRSCLGSQFIPSGLGLVVEGEFADQFPVALGDDPDVQVAGQDEDLGAGPAAADADVVEPAVMALGELAVASTRSRRPGSAR